ncbi:hypothetical protein ISF_02900 [Cordyceps fumosorosea ARSEF 2679]|uniref:Uncharacterized protein n=1 Tax=Cordyceps fumosorosea (strain ARSEF 2679) TaxID=1081104 RepID=A0A168B537_CORFA|nr:hypothetical protein ISF_02900 [Cordyceps fumosorosea ARSEF 2679]OAA69630.1 hypothetical protein ISF_02900 [Cordyceps fumosorosea ARSEF 2679]
MDNCAVSSSSPYDVLIYSGRRRDAVAHSSIRSSFDQQPSFGTTRNSKKGLRSLRFRPSPIKEVKSFQSKPPQSIPNSSRSSKTSKTSTATHSDGDGDADTDAGTYANTDTEGTWTAASTPESQRGFIDLEAGCGTWPEQIRPVPFWRRARGQLFRSRVESKIRHPESCRDVGYQVRPGFPLLKLFCWIALFFIYQLVLRIVLDEGVCNSSDWHTGNGEVLDSIVAWGTAVLAGSAAFLIGQGYFGLRATRERMERVRQTAATLAYAFIKAMSVPGGGHSQGELPLTVYECLALLTAYPVALLHQRSTTA